jgi:tRNA pseudouridine55 synthase
LTGSAEGIILLDKPAGLTSFQALGQVKRALGTGRVGHAGTLDRFADGLLVVFSGRMTRLSGLAMAMDKEYLATVTFGRQTDTLDPEGAVIREGPVPAREDIEAALPGFTGTIRQVPPQFSAIHVGGKRAYQAARDGESVDLAPREVTIHSLSLLAFDSPAAVLRVACSKGTYIRSLARDLAERLSTCAHVSRLRRTRIGGFSVQQATAPADFDPLRHLLPPEAFFDAAPDLQKLQVREEWLIRASQGFPIRDSFFQEPPACDGLYGAFGADGGLVAVLEKRGTRYRYAAAFPRGESA